MQANLEHRVSVLERQSDPREKITVIIRKLVTPGRLAEEIIDLNDGAGGHWARAEGESEADLVARASLAAKRGANGFARLIGNSQEVKYANA